MSGAEQPADRPLRPERDIGVDVLRGWAIVLMLLSHVGSRSKIAALAHFPVYVSAAEPFVLLAGLVLGMRQRLGKTDGTWRRAARFWVIHCVLMTAVLVVHETTGRLRSPSVEEAGGFLAVLWKVPTLRLQALDYMNILPLFIVFFAAAPAFGRMMARGRTDVLVLASAAMWAYAQGHPEWLRFTDAVCGPQVFVLPAWQFVFVLGLAVGFHRETLTRFARAHRRVLFPLLVSVIGAIFVFAQLQRGSFARLGVTLPASAGWLFSKETFGPVRAVYVVGLMILAHLWLGSLGASRPRWLGASLDKLLFLGKKSLYCFLVHLPLALLGSYLGLQNAPEPIHEITAIGILVAVYTLARHDVGKRWLVGT